MKPMLATSVSLSQIVYPVYASPKLDGIRCITTTANGPLTRSLKPIPNEHVRKVLTNLEIPGLDGELIVGDPVSPTVFNQTTSGVMSGAGEPEFTYFVFDLWNHHGEYPDRLAALQEKVEQAHPAHPVRVLPQVLLRTEDELFQYEGATLAEGYEGVILRGVHSLYKHGRSTVKEQYLLKRKPFADAEARIIGWQPLMRNFNEPTLDERGYTKRSQQQANQYPDYDQMGSINVIVINGPFAGTTVSIGTGFTQAQRREMATAKIVGKVIRFRYQAEGAMDAPRFPSFQGYREEGS